MNAKSLKLSAVIGGSTVVAAAAFGIAVLQGPGTAIAGSDTDMSTGATITESVAPTELSVAPQITGPAPLPSEEQGLPG